MSPRLRPALMLNMLVTSGLLLGACSSNSAKGPKPSGGTEQRPAPTTADGAFVSAVTASFEIVANRPQRVLLGISADDGSVLAGGAVAVQFRHVSAPTGTTQAPNVKVVKATAAYEPVPGQTAKVPSEPTLGAPAAGLGVYAARDVIFPAAGYWEATVNVDGPAKYELQTAIAVVERPALPFVGDDAPRTRNPLPTDPGVDLKTIDSRMTIDGVTELPSPHIHDVRIVDVLDEHRPFVVVVSTPTFCQSQFCGPITDTAADLETELAGAIDVIHLEVWKDFEANVINKAAAEWILPRTPTGGAVPAGNEPWVFIVNKAGKITARFDNVVSDGELRSAVQQAIASAK